MTMTGRLEVSRDKGFYRSLFVIALPIVFQNMITIGVNIMDTAMLGSYGEIQISGSSLANNFIDIFHILCMGLGGGAGVMISQFWGADDRHSIKQVVAIMFRICFVAMLLFSSVAILFPERIIGLYTQDEEVIRLGSAYLLWSTPTFVLQGFVMGMTLTLRSMGRVLVPFVTACISFFVNIFFNWVFIFGKLGAPELQIRGAALGTVIARTVELLIIGTYYFHFDKHLGFRFKDFFLDTHDKMKPFFFFGAPVIVSDLLLVLGNNMVSSVMGHIGTVFVAAYAIVAPVMRLCNVATQGLAQAASAMTGRTIGEKGKTEAQICGQTCFYLSIATGILSGLVLLCICPFFISIYNVGVETKLVARELMYGVIVLVVFMSSSSVLTKGVLRGGGDTKFVMVADVLFLWILSVPLGYYCGLVLKAPPFWTFLALRIDQIVKCLWCTNRLYSDKWIKKITKE